MTNFTELPSVPSDRLVPFTDQLRLGVAAYLARFKGSSRDHTESDLRCSWPGALNAAWTRWQRAAPVSETPARMRRVSASSCIGLSGQEFRSASPQ